MYALVYNSPSLSSEKELNRFILTTFRAANSHSVMLILKAC